MDAAIRCEGLVKRYGEIVALDGLHLDIPAGTIFGFLGPNGAGKTTTVRLLTGLATPTAGRAYVAGSAIPGDTQLRQKIGYLDQHPQFYPWMSGREFLHFIGELFGLRGAELRSRTDEVLELTGLTDAARRRIGGYSGGMRQRLGLAQALINRPQVLFLDEPASSLDPAGRRDVLEIIAGLRGRTTVFMSTHILADVERVCDRVAIINKGRLVVESSVTELQAQYAQPIFILEPEPGQEHAIEALIDELQTQPWASSVTADQGEIRIIADDPVVASRSILPRVAHHGIVLLRFERGRPSLEDIFLRLVGSERTSIETEAVS
ncbi:MAG: ABC transporter ATP-binding protein [Herpetosiphonaceae bacterium]|nr:MAG: ABC transporter ATP-binding protein [Herpetosiphonaceae bacterium]